MNRESTKEFTYRISQANSTELVVILYEILLNHLEEFKISAEKNDMISANKYFELARKSLNELIESVKGSYEISFNLRKLYFFCLRRLAMAQYKKDLSIVDEIKEVIVPLHDVYAQIAKENKNGPVMNNQQNIYVGLTYGKDSLNENINNNTNRGMTV